MKPVTQLLLGLAFWTIAGPASAQTPPSPQPAEVTIPNSRVIDFTSSVNGHRYRINVALPTDPAPAKGYRVLYIFDGNGYFGSVSEAVRRNGNAPDVVVVGIGYPDSGEFIAESDRRRGPPDAALAKMDPLVRARARERPYDLTLPATDAELAAESPTGQSPYTAANVGGLDQLLKTIEVDVKPRIAALTKVDTTDQALFGHSLGGLAVLRALFTEPQAYRSFIVASPSIWWNNRSVLAGEAAFVEAVKAGKATPRVLITMGSEESTPPKQPIPGMDAATVAALIARSNMVANARDLTARLQAVKGAPGYEVADYAVFADQGHGISVWPAIGRAVEFAFQR
ncbi:alpha/beta hydrolase [Sphingomonas colocasiae]|uniref:Alpha/beta hydrolase n=1 Tax=Sphingomonas colocasiae TaxID=1848973 RepID=A0ABS7PJY1_9SPHN|nr:alpha/beta hydrolase-fold protein [Sphingomonas colocasiae]MBY8821601.1 alpha/beta hydrolase [Sphingomonas colocasiae]